MFKILQGLQHKFAHMIHSKDSRYFWSFGFLLFVIFLLDIIIYIYEVPKEGNINNIFDILWWNVVTLTTVGYGDMYPTTMIGKIATILIMLTGIATFAYLLSGLVEYVLEYNQRKILGLVRINMENHIVICNWNERAQDLFKELHTFDSIKDKLVLIDDTLDTRPIDTISFVKGNPSDVESLKKANISKAKRVIILAKGNNKSDADANTILTSLAIRNQNETVMLCAEILDPNNIRFLKNAKVDHVIDINSLISRFLAQTAYNPKLLKVLNELVSNEEHSCEIYRCNLPKYLIDKSYFEIFQTVKEKFDCLVIALENSKNNQLIVNPEMNQTYGADHCFVIAKSQPDLFK